MINQISVFLENRSGQLSELTGALAAKDIDIQALNVAETAQYGVIRLIVDNYKKGIDTLVEAGFIVSVTQVAAVKVPDVPGGLNKVLEILSKESVDIEYMYSMLGKGDGYAYMIFKVGDLDGLIEILARNGLSSVTEV